MDRFRTNGVQDKKTSSRAVPGAPVTTIEQGQGKDTKLRRERSEWSWQQEAMQRHQDRSKREEKQLQRERSERLWQQEAMQRRQDRSKREEKQQLLEPQDDDEPLEQLMKRTRRMVKECSRPLQFQ